MARGLLAASLFSLRRFDSAIGANRCWTVIRYLHSFGGHKLRLRLQLSGPTLWQSGGVPAVC